MTLRSAPGTSLAVSVIVNTRNRASSLSRCLDAMAAVQFDPAAWELIVVNNAGTDATDDVVTAFAARVPFRVQLVYEPEPGFSQAKNAGVVVATAPIIIFTDDDCYVAPDLLVRVLEGFAQHTDYGYIGGRVLLYDPTDAPETIKLDETPEEMPPGSRIHPGFIHGANLAFTRELYDAIGGFDPLIHSGQDVDFVSRASAAGWKGAYLPSPVVSHHHGRKPGPDIERLRRRYALGRGAFFVKWCFDPRMRIPYLKYWYWTLRLKMKNRELATIGLELRGGAAYLWRRWTSRHRRRAVAGRT